jgi:hypothetical protein
LSAGSKTGERVRLDVIQTVGIEHIAQRHKPHPHRCALNEEQRDQFQVFCFANRPQHGDEVFGIEKARRTRTGLCKSDFDPV